MSRSVYISKSNIQGGGIFAKKDLSKGKIAFIAKGKLVKFFVKSEKDTLFGPNWMSVSKNLWLNPNKTNPLTFLNHSCEPNIGIKGKVLFVALRNIKKNEELTADYSTLELDRLWHMKCKCGSNKCRKIIKSVHYLPNKIYIKYLPFIPKYFQKVYNKEHN